MSRHFWRACDREAGFSFVELLVTIIIAAIIFAAMVPVFVLARRRRLPQTPCACRPPTSLRTRSRKSGSLRPRAIAADSGNVNPNQASPNLYDPTFADAQFGPSTLLSTGTGDRVIHTDYSVVPYPAMSTGLASQYKLVTVTTYWDGPPSPVKRVVLQTIVYRQYAGPPITDFSTAPIIYDDGVIGRVGSERDNLASVTLSAHVDLSAGVTLASLQFKVLAYGGQTMASQLVKVTDLNPAAGYWYDAHGTFYWRWDCTYAANTVYDLRATAFSQDGFAGNTPHQYPRIQHIVPLAPPGAVIATPGDARVGLQWAASPAVGVVSYELLGATSAAGPWDWTSPLATVPAAQLTYTDTASVNNGTTYYYAVRAVTSTDSSAPAISNAVTPTNSADTTGAHGPGVGDRDGCWRRLGVPHWIGVLRPMPAQASSSIEGILPERRRRHLERAATCRMDQLDQSHVSGRQRRLGDQVVLQGSRCRRRPQPRPCGARRSVRPPLRSRCHDLTISVKSGNNACNVWVLRSADGHYYDVTGNDRGTNPPSGTPIPKNGSVTFAHLPDGASVVYPATGSSPGTKTYGVVVQAPSGSLSGVTP